MEDKIFDMGKSEAGCWSGTGLVGSISFGGYLLY